MKGQTKGLGLRSPNPEHRVFGGLGFRVLFETSEVKL